MILSIPFCWSDTCDTECKHSAWVAAVLGAGAGWPRSPGRSGFSHHGASSLSWAVVGLTSLSCNLTEEMGWLFWIPQGHSSHSPGWSPGRDIGVSPTTPSGQSILVPLCLGCRPSGRPSPDPSLRPWPVSLQGNVVLMFGHGHMPSLAPGCKAQGHMEHLGKDRKKQSWGWRPLLHQTGSVGWTNTAFPGLSQMSF